MSSSKYLYHILHRHSNSSINQSNQSNFRHGRADEFGLPFQSFTERLAGLLELPTMLTQQRRVSSHLVDSEWAMCWSLEPLQLVALVLRFA
jgi:hypothetical protein